MIDIRKALDRKRLYARIHAIVSDTALTRAVNGVSGDDQCLTLPGCLLSDARKPFPPILVLESLEDNLSVLRPTITKPRRLANQLLNGCQFLNTLSELALARTLLDMGWSISLDEKFFGKKDADIVARRDTEKNFIDVTNISPMSLPVGVTVCRDIFQEMSDRSRIVHKLVEKFQEKFEVAINSGWGGRAWVALDFAKNDEENVQSFVQDLFQRRWRLEVAELVRRDCPQLAGVILYRYYPTAGPFVNRVQWIPL